MCVQFNTPCHNESAPSIEDMKTLIEEKEMNKTLAGHLNPTREAVEGRSKQRGSQILKYPRLPPAWQPVTRVRRVVLARETQTSKIW